MLKFEEIISKFQIEGEITDVKPLGHGTVNHTYEIVCGGEHYVLQEMNHIVFKYPTEVMNNLFLVTEYLRDAVCIGFITNEGLSIIENAGLMGLPLPESICQAIDVLKRHSQNTIEKQT